MNPWIRLLGAALVLVGLTACDSEIVGHVEGRWLVVDQCDGAEARTFEPYRLDAEYATLDLASGVGFIRLQHRARPLGLTDAFSLQIQDFDAVHARVGESLPLGGEGLVRASLDLSGSCPTSRQAMSAAGTVTFYELGGAIGSRVRGDVTFELMDARTLEMVGYGFTATFDFEVKAGSEYRPFSEPSALEP